MAERDERAVANDANDLGRGTPPVTEAQPGIPTVLNEEELIIQPRSVRRSEARAASGDAGAVAPTNVTSGQPVSAPLGSTGGAAAPAAPNTTGKGIVR